MRYDELPEVTPSELLKILEILDNMDDPPALMVYGPPGIGKTTILKNFAQTKGYELRVKHLSRMDTTDWSGIPKMDSDQKYTEFLPISLFKQSQNNRKIVIFFDELNTAIPQVLNAALDVILEKKADTDTYSQAAQLPSNTIIFAAGNLGPEEDGTYVEELSMAVKTRMIQLKLKVSLEDWKSWAYKSGIHEKVISYIDTIDKLIDIECFKKAEKQAPTPRGWERVSNILNTIEKIENISASEKKNLIKKLCIGTVGRKRGIEFFDYYFSEYEKTVDEELILIKATFEKILNSKNIFPTDLSEIPNAMDSLERIISKRHVIDKEILDLLGMILLSENFKAYLNQFLRGKNYPNIIKNFEFYDMEEEKKTLERFLIQ